ncbi:SRPBCC domain-containing protein [Amycolatopsis viridis]|uniref:SRPBCC domain-containing protein n=1 Tax=Amycolatopsis viridis TaxID=185678 RepID=A0ABX0T2R2_9PSEU|nr:SRPBCC domain-containing protein [Amycolatopsis viridis]NIH82199.1 hypothetical protein [Amycolatopsis viridis]
MTVIDSIETAPRKRKGRRIAIIAGTVLVIIAGYLTWSNLRRDTLTTSVEIPASADRVWQVLTDFGAYPEWNPFIVSAEVTSPGGLAKDAELRIVLRDASGDTTFNPTVLAAVPGKELRWIGKVPPGLIFDGEHSFELQPLGPGRTRLVQHERFTGALVPFMAGTLRANTLPQFEAMNRALAQRASTGS